jgi:hypothetical protein
MTRAREEAATATCVAHGGVICAVPAAANEKPARSRTTHRSSMDDVVDAPVLRGEAAECARVSGVHDRIARQRADVSAPQCTAITCGER